MMIPTPAVHFAPERAQGVSSHTLTAEEQSTRATRKLTIVDSGIIYEDEILQIGIKSDYKRGEGRLEFYFTNKTTNPLTGMRVLMPPVSYVTARSTTPPATIAPQSQARMQVFYQCELPFESFPDIQFSFLVEGRSKILKLKIPLAITKFCDPTPADAGQWWSEWQKINGKPLEIQEMFQAVTANAVHVQELLSKGFRFAIVPGVDKSPLNFVGSSIFYSPQGNVPCFIRIETNPNAQMIRLTVKSSNGQLTSALRNIFLLHLGVESQPNSGNPGGVRGAW